MQEYVYAYIGYVCASQLYVYAYYDYAYACKLMRTHTHPKLLTQKTRTENRKEKKKNIAERTNLTCFKYKHKINLS